MKIDNSYRIWRAAGEYDDGRPMLEHVLIEPEGLAIAANGFILAVVPVELEEGDVPGLVDAQTLKQALRYDGSPDGPRVSLTSETTLTAANGAVLPRLSADHLKAEGFPQWRKILPQRLAPALRYAGSIALSPRLISLLVRATGRENPMVAFTFAEGADKPVLLERCRPQANGAPQPPYGVIMPLTLGSGWEVVQTEPEAEAQPPAESASELAAVSERDLEEPGAGVLNVH